MQFKKQSITNKKGFTIVEFLVATTVFSIILLVVSMAILQIGKAYRRSMNVSNTQAATRNLVDTVAQSIQFSAGSKINATFPPPSDTTVGFCFGNKQFLYVTGRQISQTTGSTKTENAFVVREHNNCGGESIIGGVSSAGSPKELLGKGMRLSRFSVSGGGRIYTVSARVVYGDDDLLCSPSVAGSCAPAGTLTNYNLSDLTCKSGSGSEFCAVSDLSVRVQQRL